MQKNPNIILCCCHTYIYADVDDDWGLLMDVDVTHIVIYVFFQVVESSLMLCTSVIQVSLNSVQYILFR